MLSCNRFGLSIMLAVSLAVSSMTTTAAVPKNKVFKYTALGALIGGVTGSVIGIGTGCIIGTSVESSDAGFLIALMSGGLLAVYGAQTGAVCGAAAGFVYAIKST